MHGSYPINDRSILLLSISFYDDHYTILQTTGLIRCRGMYKIVPINCDQKLQNRFPIESF